MDPLTLALLAGGGLTAFLGNRSAGKQAKAATHGADVANQQQTLQQIGDTLLSQLQPGSDEYNKLASFIADQSAKNASGPLAVSELGGEVIDQPDAVQKYGQQLVSQQGQRLASGETINPYESRTNQAFDQYRQAAANTPWEQDIWNALGGQQITTPSGQVYGDVLAHAQHPDQYFTDTMGPELKLLQDQVKARAAQRGIVGSGLELEQLGRSGIDLAIKQAAARENYRQQQLANYGQVYGQGEALRGRQIGVSTDWTNLQSGREQMAKQLAANQAAASQANRLGYAGNQQQIALNDVATAQQRQQQQNQQLYQLGGAIGSAAMSGMTGIPAFPMGAGAGSGGMYLPPSTGMPTPITREEQMRLGQAGYGGLTYGQPTRSLASTLARTY